MIQYMVAEFLMGGYVPVLEVSLFTMLNPHPDTPFFRPFSFFAARFCFSPLVFGVGYIAGFYWQRSKKQCAIVKYSRRRGF